MVRPKLAVSALFFCGSLFGQSASSGVANAVKKNQTNTGTAAMTLDMSAATGANALKTPAQAGATCSAAGCQTEDTTVGQYHNFTGGVDSIQPTIPQSSVAGINNGDCPKLVKAGSLVTLDTTGAGCAAGGTGNAAAGVTTTFSTTPTFTCPSATAGTEVTFTLSTALSANITSSTLANCTNFSQLNFRFTQAAASSFTVAMPTGFGAAPQVSPIFNSNTNMSFIWDGTTARLISATVDLGPAVGLSQAAPAQTPVITKPFWWFDSSQADTLRLTNSAGTFFSLSKELAANSMRCAGGANTVDFACTAIPNGVTATTQAQNDNSTKPATTAYTDLAVANAIAGVNPAVAVLAASTANLVGTYANGVAGVGATFTVTATGTFTLDGIAINTIGQRVLLKNQSTAFQNGIYTATIVGAVAVSPVFTRALDYDQPSDINSTGAIPVQSGTANTTTSWLLTSTVNTVGTDALTFVQFSIAPSATAQLIASGSTAFATASIPANSCATTITVAATGATVATDRITWTPNADISGVTGYGVASTDGLKVYSWLTAGNINFHVCNGTGTAIVPGAVTAVWGVTR